MTVRLSDDAGAAGDLLVRINLHGVASNRARISVVRAGGGPPDDAGAVPMPAPPTPPQPTPTPAPNQFNGPASYADAVRFLEQATWGPSAAEIARVQQTGVRAYLNEQFAAPMSSYPDYPLMPLDSTSAAACPTGPNQSACLRDNYSMYPLQVRFFQNALGQNIQPGQASDQLRQRVAWALHQIFVVSGRELTHTAWMGYYLKILDRNAFGNFRTLLQEITLNPSMGEYLNMRDNRASNPNENYAREILQLFSIGLDELNLDGTPKLDAEGKRVPTYDQQDVTNFARVFTGWRESATLPANTPQGAVNYKDPMVLRNNAGNHDVGQKTLLNGFVIQAAPAGVSGQARVDYANNSLNAALDNVFNHPNVGPFVGKQLIQHLVTSNPSPAYVERVARAFNNDCDTFFAQNCQNARGDMKAVVRAVLLDPEARGDAKTDPHYGRLREPVQYINNLLRAFDATAYAGTGPSDGVIGARSRRGDLPGSLDQPVFLPNTVFSYYTPLYEVPGTRLFGPAFEILSTSTSLRRANVANTLVYQGIDPNAAGTANPDTPAGTRLNLAPLEALANDPAQLVDALNSLLLHNTMSAAVRQQIINVLTNDINDADATVRARKRAQTAVYLVVTSPQYQVQR